MLRYCQAFDIPHDKINVNGARSPWAIRSGATGHDLGTVLASWKRRDLNTALGDALHGAGMGTATIIERV